MSETIPDAILSEADEICSQIAEFGMPAQESIAQAIIAAEKRGMERERERCAKIADEYRPFGRRTDGSDNFRWGTAKWDIASAIRKGAS